MCTTKLCQRMPTLLSNRTFPLAPLPLPHTTTANQAHPSARPPLTPTPHNRATNATGPFATKTVHPPTTHSPRVLCAAALTPTLCQSSNAQPKKPGMANMTPSLNAPTGRSSSKPLVNAFAHAGSAGKGVSNATPLPTYALVVAPPPMASSAALARRRHQALTPYNPDTWESVILSANLSERFGNIPHGLRYGFMINFPDIHRVQSPFNAPSVDIYHEQLHEIVHKEITKGRYIGPFTLTHIHDAIGPFQSSPLSIIPKPGRPGKFRLVQNFSFPHNPTPPHISPSINSHINPQDFPTTWGKFSIVYLLASRLPPGSEVAT